jgi:hypothetical protein
MPDLPGPQPLRRQTHGFSGGLAAVRLGDRWGCADKTGAIVVKPQFNWALGFSEGLGGVDLDRDLGFIDGDGNFAVAPSFKDIRVFSEGMAAVRIRDKWGYIDRQGNIAVRPRFENNALPFRGGIAQVRLSGGYLGYINRSGKYVWIPTR